MITTLPSQLEALSHRAQRQVLVALLHENPRADIPIDSDDLKFDDEAVEKLFDFQHFHLPELESKGFIDYDRENHRITKGRAFEEIEPLVQLINKYSDELPDDWL